MFFRFIKEGKMGQVLAFQVLSNSREILHFLGDDSVPATYVAELKIALDNIPDNTL
jgi:hypothetical protein